MLSRALSLATVTLLIGALAAISAQAENLEAGKSASQIFAGTCNACHKSPRGLLRSVSAGSLPDFLREHYTTSADMARVLSSFLIANGATDTRGQPKQAKQEPRSGGPAEPIDRNGRKPPASAEATPQQGGKPDADGLGQGGRNAKRLARPGEPPEPGKPAAEGQTPKQAAIERPKPGARGKPGSEEPPVKPDTAKDREDAKGEPAKDAAREEGNKPEGEGKSEGKSTTAKVDAPKENVKENVGGENPGIRPDPVPPVTPAPPAATTSAAASSSPPEPAPAAAVPETPAPAAPPVAASTPPPVPVAPAGPPAPPISQ
jgi:hypothetical protein